MISGEVGSKSKKNITLAMIEHHLTYDHTTGKFFRNNDSPRAKYEEDGSIKLTFRQGRWRLSFNRIVVDYLWLVWFHTKSTPAPKGYMVYPRNGDFKDGREENLYLDIGQCTHPKQRTRKRFPKGVRFRRKKYEALLSRKNGSSILLGSFVTVEEASQCYNECVRELFETGSIYVTRKKGNRVLILLSDYI